MADSVFDNEDYAELRRNAKAKMALFNKSVAEAGNQATMRSFMAEVEEIFNNEADPVHWTFGDGDQSRLTGRDALEAQMLANFGGIYDPECLSFSQWAHDCHNGDLAKVEAHLAKQPRLLDRRETVLRMNGLFHVLHGMWTVGDCPSHLQETKVEMKPGFDHVACARFLIEQGTPVDCRNMLGRTPLFCCVGRDGNKLTLKLAEYLLEKGADINARDRHGDSPIWRAAKWNNHLCVDWLLEHGVDTKGTNYDGETLLHSVDKDTMKRKLYSYAVKRSVQDKKKKKFNRVSQKCAVCGTKDDLKKCSKCYRVFYCDSDCQKSDWESHKAVCKAIRAEYVPVTLQKPAPGVFTNWISHKLKSEQKLTGNHYFTVKVDMEEQYPEFGPILVHDEKQSVGGVLTPKDSVFAELVATVKKKGTIGTEGFFLAIWEEGKGLKINPKRIQPPESW